MFGETKCKVVKVTQVYPNRVAVELDDGRIKLVNLILLDDGIYANRESIRAKVERSFCGAEPDMIIIGER